MAEPAQTPLDDSTEVSADSYTKGGLVARHDELVDRLVSNRFTADDVKEMLIRRRDLAVERLAAKRTLRDRVNAEIRELVAEHKDVDQ